VRQRRSTSCTDKRAAEDVLASWERKAAVARDDPNAEGRDRATLADAFDLLLADRTEKARVGKGSAETVSFYTQKAATWLAYLGGDFPLASLDSTHVTRFISSRRAADPETGRPFASESSIHKELTTLRAALKRAKFAKLWRGDIGEIIEPGFSTGYVPRAAFVPTLADARQLLKALPPGRAAMIAFAIGTGAERRAIARARRDDLRNMVIVPLHGTKRRTRERQVPIVAKWQKELLRFVVKHADGIDGALFRPWVNARRGTLAACERAGLPPLTWNDFRRTYGVWLRREGVAPELIAPTMGHTTSQMVETIYGRLAGTDIAEQMTAMARARRRAV
jgi:integrase